MAGLSIRERLRTSLARTREKLRLGSGGGVEPDWDALEESLILADLGLPATTEILERVRARGGFPASLREELLGVIRAPSQAEVGAMVPPKVTLVAGVNGVGKTTTVAKLARRHVELDRRVVIIAADTFRAAAQEQLELWSKRVGASIFAGEPGRDPASVVHDGLTSSVSRRADEVIIDTAGRLHTKRPLMEELGKVERIAGRVVAGAPHEALLVMDAAVGTNGLVQAREFAAALRLTGVVLTKMDGTAKGGVVVAVSKELGLPVRYTGIGEGMQDLIPFDAEAFVDALLSN
ncbi:MAG TPA: signal recognition particle-docking protein FtsY [Vicinamibacteria bacterium]|nr:signal recognition particle-docking protein FtsY [Vicinamibacteria bacterium]